MCKKYCDGYSTFASRVDSTYLRANNLSEFEVNIFRNNSDITKKKSSAITVILEANLQ